MSKKNMNHKRQEQEGAALKQIFNTFLIGLAAECYLFIVYRGYIAGSVGSLLAWDKILHVLMWLGAAAFVGVCAAYRRAAERGKGGGDGDDKFYGSGVFAPSRFADVVVDNVFRRPYFFAADDL